MSKRISFVFLLVLLIQYALFAQTEVNIIPRPEIVEIKPGMFKITDRGCVFNSHSGFADAARFLQGQLLQKRGWTYYSCPTASSALVRFHFNKDVDPEAYMLEIIDKQIVITASSSAGAQYAVSSLLQLIFNGEKTGETIRIPAVSIKDKPLYVWRGFMLDESRHFFGKKKVKDLLDWMAFYKLNKFHWHLTDEPAWRIEIKRYPYLTLVGGVGTYTNPFAEAQYYTQSDITEIVRYAAERQIEVIPEIDMPGHATAANRAYPQYSGGGSTNHPDFTFHPGKKGTYSYLSNILREVNALFPAQIIHLGGDEVAFGSEAWNKDVLIDSLKLRHGLKTNKDVETYFMRRMADSLFAMQAKLIVWDEMAEADLPKDKTIQYWWRHDKPAQLKLCLDNGYPTVLCPRIPLYFDFVQAADHKHGRKWSKTFNPLEDLYHYDFFQFNKLQKFEGQILGIQANLWTETVDNNNRLDFLIFPRIAALAEQAWTKPERKDYAVFTQHLKQHLQLYKEGGLYYFDPFNNTHAEPLLNKPILKKYIDNPED